MVSQFLVNSFVKLGDDYLENIYYLHRYLMSAGSRGEFPLAFNGGLWRWNRDVLNWGHRIIGTSSRNIGDCVRKTIGG